MCVYNDPRFVGHAIESILTQSFEDFEFVIVDDGSTDTTPSILEKYAFQDSRIRIFRQPNAGTTAAANYGLSLVRGKYVARIDSDDISYPHRLATEVQFLEQNPDVALVGGGAHIIDFEGRIVGLRNIVTSRPERTLWHRCIYQQSDVMFRTEIVSKLGGYREKFRNAQDYDLWLRISETAQIAKLDVILGQWRLNGGGYTLSRRIEQKNEVCLIKRFAYRRRKSNPDQYENYHPPALPKHRISMDRLDYDLTVVAVLIQSMRLREARNRLLSVLQERRSKKIYVLLAITYTPSWSIFLVFKVRDIYLNLFA